MPRTAKIASPWASRGDRAAERAAKRMAVLRTAAAFFNDKGFAATSLDDVAGALQVTKPTIYHYFSSKDEILFECVRLGLEAIRDAATAAQARGGTGRDRLQALMLAYAKVMMQDFGICVSRTADEQLGPESRARFRALKRDIDRIIRDVIAAGMADGSLAQVDARVAGFTIAGALNAIARWYRPDGGMDAETVAQRTVATLIAGLAPRTQGERE